MKPGGTRLHVHALCFLIGFCGWAFNISNANAVDGQFETGAQPYPEYSVQLMHAEQAELGRHFEISRELYLNIIEQIDTIDEFNTALISPLEGLARSRAESGDYPGAESAFRRAQHLIHRSEGVHSLRQLEMIEHLTSIKLDQDEPFDADTQQRFAYYISERNFGSGSLETLPSLDRLATWYLETGQFYRARKTLERSIAIVEQEAGEKDPRLVTPLIKSAKVRRLQGSCCSYRYLETAREIVDSSETASPDQKVEVYEALADAYTESGKMDEATTAMSAVWRLLGDEVANQRFESPALIAMSERLNSSGIASSRQKILVTDQYQMGLTTPGLRELSSRERLLLASLPPQQFLVPLQKNNRNIHINDVYSPNQDIEPAQRVIGSPFQFVKDQLLEILPLTIQSDQALAALSLEFDFTVKADGRVTDIELVAGDGPNRLLRLMREVLYKTTFRPRFIDGLPVTTHHFRLIQTFEK